MIAKVGGAMTSGCPSARAASGSRCAGSSLPMAAANSAIFSRTTSYTAVGGYARPAMSGLTPIGDPSAHLACRTPHDERRGRSWGAASVWFSCLQPDVSGTSARLAVLGVLAAGGAELGELEPVGVVAPVLLGDVVAVLAHRARHRDLRSHVLGLAGHGAAFFRVEASVESRPGAGTARATARPRAMFQRTRSVGTGRTAAAP